jgi:hypothetical protein
MEDETPDARVRNAREADVPEMVELLFRAFERWPAFDLGVTAIDHLRWKMRSDPIAPENQWVVEVEGRIAALSLSIVHRARMGGREYLVREGVDAAVDPRYQGRRLWSWMADEVERSPQNAEFDLGCGFGTNPRVWHQRRRKGRKPLANPVQVLQKPYRARAIVARGRAKYGGRLPAPLAILKIEIEKALHRLCHRPYWRGARCEWSIASVERFDERIEEFFDEAARPFEFVMVRTRESLNWRYFDPASGHFTVRVAEQEGRLLGYLVFKIAEGEAYVADLLALPGRTDVVRTLVEDALRCFRDARVERATCWMISRHPYNGILQRYGFIDSGGDAGFSCFPLRPDGPDVAFVGDPRAPIHLTHGDTDWI